MSLRFRLRKTPLNITRLMICITVAYVSFASFVYRKTPDLQVFSVSANQTSIFFVESSGEKCLTARQLCSVESAARTNPQLQITVYFASAAPPTIHQSPSAKPEKNPEQIRNCEATKSLQKFANVNFVTEDLQQLLQDTELWKLVSKGSLLQSRFPIVHWSDAVRIALLWKRGGIYLDLDCVVMRKIDHLANTAGLVSHIPHWIENGVLAFEKRNPLLQYLMKYMVFAYNPADYISLGPLALTQGLKEICEIDTLEATKEYSCLNNGKIVLQPPWAFYAISNEDQHLFYEDNYNLSYWNLLNQSYVSHIYDAGNRKVVSNGSLYAAMALRYCPTTYSTAQSDNTF